MIDEEIFFGQPIKYVIKACGNICKVTTAQWVDYTTSSLLYYNYFNKW